MSRRPARVLSRIAGGLGAVAALRWLQRTRVPVLCYHSIVDEPLAPGFAGGGLHLPAATFRSQLRFLTARYRVVPLSRAVAALAGEATPLPPRSLVLTFDDGYANNARVAAPILREFGVRATCFLATAWIDRDEPYWWDEVALAGSGPGGTVGDDVWKALDLPHEPGRAAHTALEVLGAAPGAERRRLLDRLWAALNGPPEAHAELRERLRPARWSELRGAADVFDFGGHSAEHRFLDSLPAAELADDLARCRRDLEEGVGVGGPLPFAYPAGRFTPEVAAAVRKAGFAAAVDARPRPREERLAAPGVDRWAVPRVGVSSGMNLDTFAAALVGLPNLLAGRLPGAGRRRAGSVPSARGRPGRAPPR